MSIENETAESNSLYFLPEFTFRNSTFKPISGTELELADGIIWIDDRAIVFQMKTRTGSDTSESNERRWFEKKVLGKATKQIRDTLLYLEQNSEIAAGNVRGQRISLVRSHLKELHKVILYSCGSSFSYEPCYVSSTGGFIHIFKVEEYDGILRTLLTPGELFEYLTWREQELTLRLTSHKLPEQCLLGYFLHGDFTGAPSIDDLTYVFSIQPNVEDWDMSGILHRFLERSYGGDGDLNYHKILAEIAKLDRSGLRVFRERFKLSMDKANENTFTRPYRFSLPRTDCGFVFIPLEKKFWDVRRIGLINLTHAHKYDHKVSKCIGAIFVADDDGWFTVDWCFIEYRWEFDADLDGKLKEASPFRETKPTKLERYTFSL